MEAQSKDWKAFFSGCSSAVIFCHGGCPDGLGAAWLMALSLKSLGLPNYEIVELAHADNASVAEKSITSSAAVIYVDISPFEGDREILQRAGALLVLDHHGSVLERMQNLRAQMPNLLDLSNTTDQQCGASLVALHFREQLSNQIADLDWVVALLRKKDVWKWQIPNKEWYADADAFGGYVQTFSPFTLEAFTNFLADPSGCLTLGKQKQAELRKAAEDLFSNLKKVADKGDVSVYAVETDASTAVDAKRFIELCETLPSSVILRTKIHEGKVKISVGRSSETVGDVGAVCSLVGKTNLYCSGGGHPYAAGLSLLPENFDVATVASDILNALFDEK